MTDGVDCPDMRVAALTAAAEHEEALGRSAEAIVLLEEASRILEAKGNVMALRHLAEASRQPVP